MARPKKALDHARRFVVKFLLNGEEMTALEQKAARHGVVANDWARFQATSGRAPLRGGFSDDEPPALYELRQQLTRIGVNLNQIARRLNATGEHEPEALKDACADLDEVLRRLLASESFR